MRRLKRIVSYSVGKTQKSLMLKRLSHSCRYHTIARSTGRPGICFSRLFLFFAFSFLPRASCEPACFQTAPPIIRRASFVTHDPWRVAPCLVAPCLLTFLPPLHVPSFLHAFPGSSLASLPMLSYEYISLLSASSNS